MTASPDDALFLSGSWGSLSVHPIGATVTSWRPGGREALYTASDAVPGTEAMWHGGIPVCTPWFGVGTGDWEVPFIHGLVSRVRWRVVASEAGEDRAHVVLATDGAATAHLPGADRFPADLRYELDVVADASRLTLGLTVATPSRDAVVEMALHPYLLTDARTATVDGLQGARYTDYAAGVDGTDDAPVPVGRYLDRVYREYRPTTIVSDEGTLRLAAQGAGSVVVWNPGPEDPPVPGDEWSRFVCVEYGEVKSTAVLIPAGASHLLRMTIAV
ncbi:hypothetical protein BW730_10395 [Tessaracoccus aquimaris]|uniref:Glucose-6-phosphate 1-epimerase n=1 Tax=Tessaracoccus aquimaris TaxID=1332264 RepID=A0A1Q2CP03_9ACTN|nr:hypothetical protein [Tessaracoccus aquimaris]AQP47842.1 hypothetical protein BW730_10395 [Tessaracoccus aquimaris]